MGVPITNYVNVSVALEGSGVQPAGFGNILFVSQTTVGGTSDRVVGPFQSMTEVTDYGFTSSDNFYKACSAIFSQSPRAKKVYLGRRLAGDANVTAALTACQAENGSVWYGVLNEDRTDTEILEVAAWCESRFKLAMCQSDSTAALNGTGQVYTITFGGTETDGDYEVDFSGAGLVGTKTVTITRAGGSPATNILLATAFAAELTTQNAALGDIEGVLTSIVDNGDGSVTITADRTLAQLTVDNPVATGPATLSVSTDDDDVARQMFDTQYSRTALVYHDDDSEYLDAAWMARCFSFNLDQKKGIWAYQSISGVPSVDLTGAQATALRSKNVNYFSPIAPTSGVATQAYTAQGRLPYGSAAAGRPIDVQTSLDWLQARLEEALLNVLLKDSHGVPYTDAGINRFVAAIRDVFSTGLAAGHLIDFVVPDGQDYAGKQTPLIVAPLLSETSSTERANRTLTFNALAYLRSAIESVTFSLEVRQ